MFLPGAYPISFLTLFVSTFDFHRWRLCYL